MINLDERVGVRENNWVVRYISFSILGLDKALFNEKEPNFYLAYDLINFNFDILRMFTNYSEYLFNKTMKNIVLKRLTKT